MARPPEISMPKNPSLPRDATENSLRRGPRGQAWLGWVPHPATVRINLRQNYKCGQAGNKCPSILSGSFQLVGAAPSPILRAWPCCPGTMDIRPSQLVHSQDRLSLERSRGSPENKPLLDMKTNSIVLELQVPFDISQPNSLILWRGKLRHRKGKLSKATQAEKSISPEAGESKSKEETRQVSQEP